MKKSKEIINTKFKMVVLLGWEPGRKEDAIREASSSLQKF